MSTLASILASLVALFELVSSAIKKAKVAREEAKIKECGGTWFCDHFSNPNTSDTSDTSSVHDDTDGSNTEAKS